MLTLLRVKKPVCMRSPLTKSIEFKRKKKQRECSSIKAPVSVCWLAVCYIKWLRGSRVFQHPEGFKPMSPYSLLLALITKQWGLPKNTVYDLSHLATLNQFSHAGFLFLDCSSLISRPDTIYQNSWQQPFYQYILIDLSWNIFTLHNFFSKLSDHCCVHSQKSSTHAKTM